MLFLSIKPKYVEKMLSGEKRVELRRRKPRSVPGDWIAIYETTPTCSLVAIAQVEEVRAKSPHCLWPSINTIAGVSKREFDEYFTGCKNAVGIFFQLPLVLPVSVPLVKLRDEWPTFHPPQSFLYLTSDQVQFVFAQFGVDENLKSAA